MKLTLEFLNELSSNNNRDWFQANKKRYDQSRLEVIALAREVHSQLVEFDPTLTASNPDKSVFRIYRDTRFSANKTPYKNNQGFWLSKGEKNDIYAGYYVHCQPGESFIAAGIWMPPAPQLNALRQEIHFNHEVLRNILHHKTFKSIWENLDDQQLKSMPRGYEKDHPAADLLKYKSYVVSKQLSDKEMAQKDLAQSIVKDLKTTVPLVHFLNQALEMGKD